MIFGTDCHNGITPTTGACVTGTFLNPTQIRVATSYTRIVGIALQYPSLGANVGAFFVPAAACSDVLIDGCLANCTDSPNYGFQVSGSGMTSDSLGHQVRNCIVRSGVGAFVAGGTNAAGGFVGVEFDNCTSLTGVYGVLFANSKTTSGGLNLTIKNTIGIGFDNGCFYRSIGGGDGTITFSNNCSTDATADNFGGSGHLINQNRYQLFNDPDHGDLTLRPGSPLIGAGVMESFFGTLKTELIHHEAESLVQRDEGSVGIGSQLAGGGPQGIAGLQGMTALHAAATVAAAAHVDRELTVNRPPGDFGLILPGGVRFIHVGRGCVASYVVSPS